MKDALRVCRVENPNVHLVKAIAGEEFIYNPYKILNKKFKNNAFLFRH